MTDRRIRHLPVMHEGKLIGFVSIGDVVKRRIQDVEEEADQLRAFVAGNA
jgi:CBS domain-containing protein